MEQARHQWALWTLTILGLAGALFTGIKPSLFYREAGMWFLAVHTLIEFFTVAVSLVLGLYSFLNYKVNESTRSLILCITFLTSGIVFVLHTFSFGGMPETLIFPSANTGMYFWLAAQFILVIGFLASVLVPKTSKSRLGIAAGVGITFVISTAVYFFVYLFNSQLPALVSIWGLNMDKKIAEYVLMALLAVIALLFFKESRDEGQPAPLYLLAFFIFTIFTEFEFTLYPGVYYLHDVFGHIFRLFAYMFLLAFFTPQFKSIAIKRSWN